jgi:hypothetical protein
MTLVELLVGMAVTAVVLVGLTGILYDVTSYYQGWADRLGDASTGGALAAALQRDSERSIVCHTTGAHVQQLGFCIAGTPTVTALYTIQSGGATFSIYRQEQPPAGPTILMARGNVLTVGGAPQQPSFWSECIPGPGTISGHIHVYDFRSDARSDQSFSVYYHTPMPASGGCPA